MNGKTVRNRSKRFRRTFVKTVFFIVAGTCRDTLIFRVISNESLLLSSEPLHPSMFTYF